MKKLIFGICFLVCGFVCEGQTQDSALRIFTEKWIADSLGCNGFREAKCVNDTAAFNALINGISIKGWEKEKVIALLGKADWCLIQKDNTKETCAYILQGDCICEGWCEIWLDINYKDNKVYEVWGPVFEGY